MNPSQRKSLSVRWPWLVAVFIASAIYAFGVMAVIRGFRLSSSDVTTIGLSFGVPLVGLFALLNHYCFPALSALARVSVCGILAFVLAAVAFWVAFIAVWGVFGGGGW